MLRNLDKKKYFPQINIIISSRDLNDGNIANRQNTKKNSFHCRLGSEVINSDGGYFNNFPSV